MFAISKNDCVGSAGLALGVCLEQSIFVKKHRSVHKAPLSCSKVMTYSTFPGLVEKEEKFWGQADLCCNPGSPPQSQCPHFPNGGEMVFTAIL